MFSFTAPDITTTDGMIDVNVYRNCLLFRSNVNAITLMLSFVSFLLQRQK